MRYKQAHRGINLGGWLVVEKWMTPELFTGVKQSGELALYRELGTVEAKKRIQRHRDTFISEQDFQWISRHGFTLVRLPVGYWAFENVDDYVDDETYIDRAFIWAKKYNLRVILDFHGLQGSQNGYDHSGETGKIGFYKHRNRTKSLATLGYMARKYGKHPSLIGIEVVNEPKARWFIWRILRYYDKAVSTIEPYVRPDVKIILSDAFKPRRMALALKRRKYFSRIVLDIHLYQLYNWRDQRMGFSEHLYRATHDWADLLDDIQSQIAVLVGEWSAALPATMQRPKALGQKHIAAKYYQAQLQTFDEGTWGHCYWTYKAPGCGDWSYKQAHVWLLK